MHLEWKVHKDFEQRRKAQQNGYNHFEVAHFLLVYRAAGDRVDVQKGALRVFVYSFQLGAATHRQFHGEVARLENGRII